MSQSFYGGPKGQSFVIAKVYETENALKADFINENCEVQFGEYAIEKENSGLYKRVYEIENHCEYLTKLGVNNITEQKVYNNVEMQVEVGDSTKPSVQIQEIEKSGEKVNAIDLKLPQFNLSFNGATLQSSEDGGYSQTWILDGMPELQAIKTMWYDQDNPEIIVYMPGTTELLQTTGQIYYYTMSTSTGEKNYFLGMCHDFKGIEISEDGLTITIHIHNQEDVTFKFNYVTNISQDEYGNLIITKGIDGESSDKIALYGIKNITLNEQSESEKPIDNVLHIESYQKIEQVDADGNVMHDDDGNIIYIDKLIDKPLQIAGIEKIETIFQEDEEGQPIGQPINLRVFMYGRDSDEDYITIPLPHYEIPEATPYPLVGEDTQENLEKFYSYDDGAIWFVLE